jgi:hypothetical protein
MATAGRKAKYSTELLLKKLDEYLLKFPQKTVKLSEISKFTNIPRHIWRDNTKAKEIIEKINNMEIMVDTTKLQFILPSAEEIVNKCVNNKEKLLASISELLDLASSLYDKAIKVDMIDDIVAQYKDKLQEKEYEIINLKKEIMKLNKEIDNLYLDSRDYVKRSNLGIRENLIELTPNHLKSISKNTKDIEDEFSYLFDK